jgi:hypothetical protein
VGEVEEGGGRRCSVRVVRADRARGRLETSGWARACAGRLGQVRLFGLVRLGRVGLSFFLFFFSISFSYLIEYAFEAPNKIRKMQMRYRWKPYEKSFTMKPYLRQNKILFKLKFA